MAAIVLAALVAAVSGVLPSLLPMPQRLTVQSGVYALPARTTVSGPEALAAIARRILTAHGAGATLRLGLTRGYAIHGPEAYRLDVTPSGIAIQAPSEAGLFYGLQTLDQLLPPHAAGAQVRTVTIDDWPTYRWRGIHLDVSRHFFGIDVVKRYIDVAARYKLNVFHLHLDDDQGWRLQIRRYPRLTAIGSCRAQTQVGHDATEFDGKRYCGFYTQAQIRDLVAYARARYVTIVPEIEMPGHSQAALAAYPRLACEPRAYAVRETWGESDQIYCPSAYTFGFLENVLREVIALFPSRYVHIGGDEVPKNAWESSALVRGLMVREHIATYAGVQGYFDRRIEHFLLAHGRRMIGWDEILDGGVTKTATIMSWRGTDGGIKAARAGNDAVMTPDGPLYFDAYQGDRNDEPEAIGGLSTPQMVYEYEPAPAALSVAQRRHIVGVQGNLWTEYIATPDYVFYMLLPRMLALSEIAWSDPQPRDWSAFSRRMGAQLPRLQSLGYNFRIPNPTFSVGGGTLHFANVSSSVRTVTAQSTSPDVTVTIAGSVPGAAIYYTTDGSEPSVHSRPYRGTLHLHFGLRQRADITAILVMTNGRASTPSELVIYR